jgi:hypothetical protein
MLDRSFRMGDSTYFPSLSIQCPFFWKTPHGFSRGCLPVFDGTVREYPALTWYLTQCMAATRKNGVVITRTRRPHPYVRKSFFFFHFQASNYLQIQVTALSSFAIARNRSANMYFALPNGIYLFATKAHTDVKRMLCKLGLSVHDTTVRRADTVPRSSTRVDANKV